MKPETMKIDDVEYVRKDSIQDKEALEEDGLKYAIVRSRNQGVMSGFVKSINGQHVELVKARQLWRWSSKFVLVDMAEYGPTDKWESKFSCESSQPVILLEACGVLYCTLEAAKKIREVKAIENE